MIANITFTTDKPHEMSVKCRTEHEADLFAERLEQRLSVPVFMHITGEENQQMHRDRIQEQIPGDISSIQSHEEGEKLKVKEMLSVPFMACDNNKRDGDKEMSRYSYYVEIDVIDDMTVEECYKNSDQLYGLLPEKLKDVGLIDVFELAVKVPKENLYQFRITWWDFCRDEICWQQNLEDFLSRHHDVWVWYNGDA